jgi:hypothetical protein
VPGIAECDGEPVSDGIGGACSPVRPEYFVCLTHILCAGAQHDYRCVCSPCVPCGMFALCLYCFVLYCFRVRCRLKLVVFGLCCL